jgi:lambda repressor-like predicted transcriptional regulator
MDYDVCWHTGAWLDVLNLPPARDVPRERVVAAIERWASTLAAWGERDPDLIGDLPWAWVLPEAKLFDVLLPDGTAWGFRDLRLYCLDWDPVPRVCVIAVHPEGAGGRRIQTQDRTMQASSRQERAPGSDANGVPPAVQILPAYLEKSPSVQAVIRDLLNIARNDRLPPEERKWAEAAVHDALFRYQACEPDKLGALASREERHQLSGLAEEHQRMEEEERAFAANLARLLGQRNLSQAELARRVGVGPSAISMMLSRRCRPQQRTVEKIARALEVDVGELWPG